MEDSKYKVLIYGGNGFVGTHIAKLLSQEDLSVVCLSRSGHKPLHLHDQAWSKSVRWCADDASKPDTALMESADCVIILVGCAPLPTFSKAAFNKKLHNNGTAPARAIKEAARAGVRHIILMGAQIPSLLNKDWFAYAKGKKIALNAAKEFVESHPDNSAVVIQPSAIYGKRYLLSGKLIPLDLLLSPFARILPSKFVNVEKVAECATQSIIKRGTHSIGFKLIKHENITR